MTEYIDHPIYVWLEGQADHIGALPPEMVLEHYKKLCNEALLRMRKELVDKGEIYLLREAEIHLAGIGSEYVAAEHGDHAVDAAITAAEKFASNGHASIGTCGLVTINAATVQPKKICFIWPTRLAKGKHTTIAGDPGLGKSQISIAIVAAVTTGKDWPCGEGKAPLGNVIILSAEDGIDDVIIPRLIAAGADLNRITIVNATVSDDGKGHRSFNLQTDVAKLEHLTKEIGDVRLIVIDPITAYLGKVDSHKNADVRGVLQPFGEMAERTKIAVLSITHLNKASGLTIKALHRVIGSIAFTAAPRAALVVIEDPEDSSRRMLLHLKTNIGPKPKGLAFRLLQDVVVDTDEGDCAPSYVNWEKDPVTNSADEAMNNGKEHRTTKDSVMELLEEILKNGAVSVQDIEEMARNEGLLEEGKRANKSRPFQAAKEELRIETVREGFGAGSKCSWKLPHRPPSWV